MPVPASRIFDAPNAHDRELLCSRLSLVDRLSIRESLRGGLDCRERIAGFEAALERL